MLVSTVKHLILEDTLILYTPGLSLCTIRVYNDDDNDIIGTLDAIQAKKYAIEHPLR